MTQIIVLVLLILLNGFFAATEISFISLNDAKIDMMAKEGNKKAKKIKKMLENPSKFLSTIERVIYNVNIKTSALNVEIVSEMINTGVADKIIEDYYKR